MCGVNALVTGASRPIGIGQAIARRLREDGSQVFTHGWSPHDSDETTPTDVEADFVEADAPARVVAAARAALGPLDTLVVNHARSGDGRLHELTAEHIDAFLHENVRASLLLVKEFADQFEGTSGRVVLLTSGAHLGPMTGEVAYAVSKGALAIATATLAEELADRGITVNCLNPGPTDTGWGLADIDPTRRMPFGRWGEPDDVARLVAWLCSDAGRWVTGQVIDSEGGFRRGR
jgi:3-oxoacyl-[acyl-carrier protein] reductase